MDFLGLGVNWQFLDNNDWGFDFGIFGIFVILDSDGFGLFGNLEDVVFILLVFDVLIVFGSLMFEFDYYFV